ncbi:hypothetical protein BC830DRAFT_1136086 [Chytriomyces sp. MP71]|nr:hypothetical protein BC830DRAFT_1136086 [Chytriomyces sp. MP71]
MWAVGCGVIALAFVEAQSSHSGTVTWFGDQGNWATVGHVACGHDNFQSDFFAAISVHALSDTSSIVNSGLCGHCARLSYGSNAVTVTIVDVMMDEGRSASDLDISYAAFSALTSPSDGMISGVGWDNVDCALARLLRLHPMQWFHPKLLQLPPLQHLRLFLHWYHQRQCLPPQTQPLQLYSTTLKFQYQVLQQQAPQSRYRQPQPQSELAPSLFPHLTKLE